MVGNTDFIEISPPTQNVIGHSEALVYRILRFWNNQIDREMEGVVETILAALANGSPPGSLRSPPSPRGEGK